MTTHRLDDSVISCTAIRPGILAALGVQQDHPVVPGGTTGIVVEAPWLDGRALVHFRWRGIWGGERSAVVRVRDHQVRPA